MEQTRLSIADAPMPPSASFGWKRFVPLVLLVGVIAAFFGFGLHGYLTFDQLRQHRGELMAFVAGMPVKAVLIFIAVYAGATALSLPGGVVLTLSGGFLFGIWQGTAAVVIGATIGATAIFLAARFLFAEMLRAKAGPWLAPWRPASERTPPATCWCCPWCRAFRSSSSTSCRRFSASRLDFSCLRAVRHHPRHLRLRLHRCRPWQHFRPDGRILVQRRTRASGDRPHRSRGVVADPRRLQAPRRPPRWRSLIPQTRSPPCTRPLPHGSNHRASTSPAGQRS